MTRFPLLGLSRLRMQTDGTGVTTLVAGAGCPLSCKWCINRRILSEKRAEFLSLQELFARVRCDDLYFRATGGGVTFGGGEPLLHAAFLAEFRALCPDWRLTVETSLNVAPELLVQYGQQIASRMVGSYRTLLFMGQDIRQLRAAERLRGG